MTEFRHLISLDGDDWRLAQAPGNEPGLLSEAAFVPAAVPGDVRLDLLRAGRLPDPHFGQNSRAARWVDTHDWWLVRDLSGLDLPSAARVFLHLRGVDYVSDVYWDGQHLGRHEGMFSPQVYEVTDLIPTSAAAKLAVRVAGTSHLPFQRADRFTRLRDRLEGRVAGSFGRWPHRRSTLKAQMGFGWDFCPDLPSLGIWDDVELILTGDVFIRNVWARPAFNGESVRLDVTLDLDIRVTCDVEIDLNLFCTTADAPPVMEQFPITLTAGRRQLDFRFDVPEPRLWWPWDHGQPHLYRLQATVRRRGERLDNLSQTVGLRQIALRQYRSPDAPAEALPWVFVVNGQPLFLRGANWVPASIFPGQVTTDDYRELLELARQANMNALRVWGGGLREKAAFYDTCDRLGLLVWQEFPLACAFLTRHPRTVDYLALVSREARAIVRTLRGHPSLALWCGGNEFNPQRDAPLVRTLAAVVAAEDPTRPFVPASPAPGDRHNWRVWHGFAPPGAYRQETPQFASEFGLQAPPVAESLRQFIPEKELWPPGPSWAHHHAQWNKLWRYAAPFLGGRRSPRKVTLAEFLAASQRAQAHGLQVAIEHHRRRKYACGGCLLWQFNSPWPAIEWAIVDHYRRPKLAYHVVQRVYAPVLLSLEYADAPYGAGSQFCPSVWAINDRAEALTGCRLVVTLEAADGQLLERFERELDVAADSAEVVGRFCWTLPTEAHWVRCRLYQDKELLSFNEYDLTVYDGGRPGWRNRLHTWLADRLLNT